MNCYIHQNPSLISIYPMAVGCVSPTSTRLCANSVGAFNFVEAYSLSAAPIAMTCFVPNLVSPLLPLRLPPWLLLWLLPWLSPQLPRMFVFSLVS